MQSRQQREPWKSTGPDLPAKLRPRGFGTSRGGPRGGWMAGSGVVEAEGEADTAAVAEESSGVDQRRPAKAGTPTSRAVAEESRGVDQRRPAKAGTPTAGLLWKNCEALTTCLSKKNSVGRTLVRQGELKPTLRLNLRAVAEESRGVDQGAAAQAGTPTSRAVAEESRGVNQRRPATAGTATAAASTEESRGVDQAAARVPSGKESLS